MTPEATDYDIPPLDPGVRQRAVAHLRQSIDDKARAGLRAIIARDPEHWSAAYHFGRGLGIRNSLRQAGIQDNELPTGLWDDYYVACVEEAVQEPQP